MILLVDDGLPHRLNRKTQQSDFFRAAHDLRIVGAFRKPIVWLCRELRHFHIGPWHPSNLARHHVRQKSGHIDFYPGPGEPGHCPAQKTPRLLLGRPPRMGMFAHKKSFKLKDPTTADWPRGFSVSHYDYKAFNLPDIFVEMDSSPSAIKCSFVFRIRRQGTILPTFTAVLGFSGSAISNFSWQ